MNPLSSERPAAVVGAGAIGLSLASALARAVRSITVCGGRKPVDRIEITEDGISETCPARHVTDPADIAGHTTAIAAASVLDGSTTSMRKDRLAGRPLAYDAFTEAVVQAAERHGIDVPATRFVPAHPATIEPEVAA